jgi:hypothetical protein
MSIGDDWDDIDGYRVFGWHVKAGIVVAPETKLESSDPVLVYAEVSWIGGGSEIVTATVSAKYAGKLEHEGYVQIGILRDPPHPPGQVNFSVRNDTAAHGESKEYVDATGRPGQTINPRAWLFTKYGANGVPDSSMPDHPHLLLWGWTMENRMDFYSRVGRITAV